jgi:hypothetical protein
LDRPDGLVWRIVERYCALALCPEDGFDGPAAAPLPHGVWSYGEDQGPTLSTPQGVHCVFADLSNRLRKELFCRGLVRDLETMASALLAASGLGFLVDWSKIEIARSVEADRQTVTVNALGDYLRLHLPVLVRVPALRDDALQWVRRRVSSRPASWLVVDADRFLGRGGLDE